MLVKPYNGPGVPAFPDVAKLSDAELADWVRGQAETLYHPVPSPLSFFLRLARY